MGVMGHAGLTPQSASDPSQFRVQGRTAEEALQIIESARQLEAAGCFSIVLECVPAPVGELMTQELRIPTIGIGAGAACDGQVLVSHDVLGLYPLFSPKFVQRYADLGEAATQAVQHFRADVTSGKFPQREHAFTMPPEDRKSVV